MHDCKGRPVAEGDVVKVKTYNGKSRVGVIVDCHAQSATCNLVVAMFSIAGPVMNTAVTAKETELIVKADGTDGAEVPAQAA